MLKNFNDIKFQHLQTTHPFYNIFVFPFLPMVYQNCCLKELLTDSLTDACMHAYTHARMDALKQSLTQSCN